MGRHHRIVAPRLNPAVGMGPPCVCANGPARAPQGVIPVGRHHWIIAPRVYPAVGVGPPWHLMAACGFISWPWRGVTCAGGHGTNAHGFTRLAHLVGSESVLDEEQVIEVAFIIAQALDDPFFARPLKL